MGPRTTFEQRKLVINHFQKGLSRRKIAEAVNMSPATVQHIINRFVHENRLEDKGRSAPNKIFTPADERTIIRKGQQNPMLSLQR